MKIMSLSATPFFLMMISYSLFADEYSIADFADSYISKNLSNYHFPQGELNAFIKEHLSKEGKSTRPWSVTADFNGDKKDDWAGLLSDEEQDMDVVLIYSIDDEYKHNILHEGVGKDTNQINTGVYIEKPGIVRGFPFDGVPEEDLVADLLYPGIHVIFFETSSVLYYFKGSEIHELWTSD